MKIKINYPKYKNRRVVGKYVKGDYLVTFLHMIDTASTRLNERNIEIDTLLSNYRSTIEKQRRINMDHEIIEELDGKIKELLNEQDNNINMCLEYRRMKDYIRGGKNE